MNAKDYYSLTHQDLQRRLEAAQAEAREWKSKYYQLNSKVHLLETQLQMVQLRVSLAKSL